MSDQDYPAYVGRMLAEARQLLEADDYAQADAASLCYEVLALFPEHEEAAELVLEAFNDPWLIRDKRKALGRHIDEWDDRAWQQRRRLALSFRYMSRWDGRHRAYDDETDVEDVWPSDVRAMLQEGKGQLLQDYLLGQSKGSELAWPIFQEAFRRTANPRVAMLWVAHLYADQGFFAESVEVLEQMLAQFPQAEQARRLWAEVRWWRDHQDRIPWIPPVTTTDGSRYRRMMARMDPDFAADEEIYMTPMDHIAPDPANLPPDFEMPVTMPEELKSKLEALLGEMSPKPARETAVDWSYLDALEMDDIDVAQFPAWAQYLLLEIDDPEQEAYLKQYLLSYFSNPPLSDEEEKN